MTVLMVGNQIAFATDMLINNESDEMDSLTYLQTAFNAGHAWAGAR